MKNRRTTAATALALSLVVGPAAVSLAQGTYPPVPPPGVSPTVQPTPPTGVSPGVDEDEDDTLGAALPKTGAGIAAAGAAGVALVGGGALLVAGTRRRRQQS